MLNRLSDTATAAPAAKIDPITIEIIGNAIASIADEMGEILVRASYSTNIKERRDCSTVIFDAAGRTLYQAEHIPIHLGSLMGVVEEILARHNLDTIVDGDTFIGNDAYTGGGTHLPDIVLASPIFYEERLVGWATNLAHHADFVDRAHAHIFQEGLRIPPIRRQAAQSFAFEIIDPNIPGSVECQTASVRGESWGVRSEVGDRRRLSASIDPHDLTFLNLAADIGQGPGVGHTQKRTTAGHHGHAHHRYGITLQGVFSRVEPCNEHRALRRGIHEISRRHINGAKSPFETQAHGMDFFRLKFQ
jgi:hypothetical protein